MRFKSWKERIKRALGFSIKKMEKSIICGVELKSVKGTVRKKTDQDDAWFFALAKHHDIIFDIGSNVGYNAMLAMVQKPDRTYILIDPNPLALADANLNLGCNGFGKKAFYYPAFVSNKNGEKVKFYTIGTGAAGSMFKSHAATAASLNSWFHVETKTLDYLIEFYNIVPELIKVDVEGAESLVLEGAYEITKKLRPIYMVEMHANEEISMEVNVGRVLKWCKKVNYNAWYMKRKYIVEDPQQIAHRGKCHLLLQCSTLDFPAYLKNIDQSDPLPISIS